MALLQGLFDEQTDVIRWKDKRTEPFAIKRGVRQGCIVSPRLFTLYTEMVTREADISDFGVPTGGRIISNLQYADDSAAPVDGMKDPTEVLRRLDYVGSRKGLKINVSKSKWLSIAGMAADITIAGQRIERVDAFKYLGSIKTGNGDCEKDIRARIAMEKKRTLELVNVWKDRHP